MYKFYKRIRHYYCHSHRYYQRRNIQLQRKILNAHGYRGNNLCVEHRSYFGSHLSFANNQHYLYGYRFQRIVQQYRYFNHYGKCIADCSHSRKYKSLHRTIRHAHCFGRCILCLEHRTCYSSHHGKPYNNYNLFSYGYRSQWLYKFYRCNGCYRSDTNGFCFG